MQIHKDTIAMKNYSHGTEMQASPANNVQLGQKSQPHQHKTMTAQFPSKRHCAECGRDKNMHFRYLQLPFLLCSLAEAGPAVSALGPTSERQIHTQTCRFGPWYAETQPYPVREGTNRQIVYQACSHQG